MEEELKLVEEFVDNIISTYGIKEGYSRADLISEVLTIVDKYKRLSE